LRQKGHRKRCRWPSL